MNMPTELCRMQVSELQRRLAKKATDMPEHRFTKLYDLLTWEPLMAWAFDKLMTNVGSRTAGIDGMGKRTAQEKRDLIIAELRGQLKAGTYQHQPVRRVYIPKANGKRRPLGIPTLIDRLVQLMVKAILEPIFESDFRPESHGFRPQRSCHTAMAHLHLMTAPSQKKMYWVIEGDITGCFDHIQHKTLMRLLRRRIWDNKLLGVIWQMLRAGVMEGELFKKTSAGTPQGGIISPLLANVYLHEIDAWFHQNYTGLNYNEKNKRRKRKEGNAFYVRYADDFVVAWNGTKEGAERIKAELSTFLRDHLGLELSAEKTRITHVTEGYDFLGFTVKRYSSRRRGRSDLIIRPSEKSVMKLKAKIKAMTKRGTTLDAVRDKIKAMNYLLKGWANYFRHQASSSTFDYIGNYAFRRMEIWLKKKTRQRIRAVYRQYYRKPDTYHTWVAGGMALYHPGVQIKIERMRYAHRPNPYLNATNEVYLTYHRDPLAGKKEWGGAHFYGEGWTEVRDEVLTRDGRKCRVCGKGGRVEVHHIRPHQPGRPHELHNLITLCATCHRQVRDPQSEVSRQLARITP
ncbi:group II intron reverse transcriptase/maturase [Candidatus Chloroploca sp. M-50]|uniref:Group II intron reverse transcriptase/maturase n=1 Tax=Candidatus Chloroploca mongolica TaxID=2528176 RepID=A0ABS4D9Y1_9CHLR|nr:group II intron reverse transcriptase/maturase [Candidatus Chloroploca mongolica]MBP1466255.1 group II intron reverse transcriptase/maturase [Candidatus Chloroploca mongolica]